MLRRWLHIGQMCKDMAAHLGLRNVRLGTCRPRAREMRAIMRLDVLFQDVLIERVRPEEGLNFALSVIPLTLELCAGGQTLAAVDSPHDESLWWTRKDHCRGMWEDRVDILDNV